MIDASDARPSKTRLPCSSARKDPNVKTDFRVIETGAGEASWNMALDWALLDLRGEGLIPDTLRFYTWRDKTVSAGYSQDIAAELDLDRCRKNNVAVVYRATGGALVLHDRDLTYSVVTGMGGLSPACWREFSRRVGCALCKGMRNQGLDPVCVRENDMRDPGNHGACFSNHARHEITVDGCKIIGNARRWRNGALLQHGSVSIRKMPLSVVDLMAGLTTAERISKKRELETRSTTMEDASGRITSYKNLWPVMLESFRSEFSGKFRMGDLSDLELSRAGSFMERVTFPSVPRRAALTRSGNSAAVNA